MRLKVWSVAPLLGLALIGCRPLDTGSPIEEAASAPQSTVGAAMRSGHRVASLRVIDGDTFEADGETIRISNIDTPETAPRARCQAEAALAAVATRELEELLGVGFEGSASGILPTIHREGTDRYGRTLAKVSLVTGGDAGEEMIKRGVAVRWAGRRAAWCE